MNNMEIKQGDKVRVSKDAPRIYTPDWVDEMFNLVLKVAEVEDGNAMVVFAERTPYKTVLTTIPCKYLVKVDAEAKESKFKVGDIVIHKNSPHIWRCVTAIMSDNTYVLDGEIYDVDESELTLYTEPTAPTIKVGDRVRCKNPIRLANSTDDDFIGTVTDAENGWFIVHMNNGAIFQTYHESDLELVQPKEQKEAEKKTNVGSIKIPVEVDITDCYWDAYTADLAKEIALKVANKKMDNHPEEIGAYAVRVAKSVVENLKNKQI